MSESTSSGRAVLNWRGPLLAGAIFAGVFAVLLLIANQNESNASDPGSSFRQDPYGTSLLFDSLQRAGYRVQRSPDEKTLDDQDAAQTTAFFIGGERSDDTFKNGQFEMGPKFGGRLENFLEHGGRAVLIETNDAMTLKSASQGWEIRTEARKRGVDRSGPAWAAPDSGALPQGSERMYLASDSPWLQIDGGWKALYVGAEAINSAASAAAMSGSGTHVYMAARTIGTGELIVGSQESFLWNETIKTHPNPTLLDFLAGGRPVIWVDETLHGMQQDEGVLWLVQRYRLQAALLLFWATLLALLWGMSSDLVRRPAHDRSAEIIRHGEHAGVAAQRLLRRSIAKENVVMECWDQFRRRSAADAQAISADQQRSLRLRAAFAMPPVEGYKALRDLIAERRASANKLVRTRDEAYVGVANSARTISEEARLS